MRRYHCNRMILRQHSDIGSFPGYPASQNTQYEGEVGCVYRSIQHRSRRHYLAYLCILNRVILRKYLCAPRNAITGFLRSGGASFISIDGVIRRCIIGITRSPFHGSREMTIDWKALFPSLLPCARKGRLSCEVQPKGAGQRRISPLTRSLGNALQNPLYVHCPKKRLPFWDSPFQ